MPCRTSWTRLRSAILSPPPSWPPARFWHSVVRPCRSSRRHPDREPRRPSAGSGMMVSLVSHQASDRSPSRCGAWSHASAGARTRTIDASHPRPTSLTTTVSRHCRPPRWTPRAGLRRRPLHRAVRAGAAHRLPPHQHRALEQYIPLAAANWWKENDTWRQHPAGALIHHDPERPHAMRTDDVPFFAIYVWRDDVMSSSNWSPR